MRPAPTGRWSPTRSSPPRCSTAPASTPSSRSHYWVGDVLARVSRDCAARDEPLLSALCVNSKGSVGPAYAEVVGELTGEAPADPDDHAAACGSSCYRRYDADGLPEGGGHAALVPMLAQARTRARKAAAQMRPVPTCPTCIMALLPTGVCDTCD